jgi:transposase
MIEFVIAHPINGERVLLSVEQALVPTLLPGDIVVMDNLGSHKSQAVRKAIRAVGANVLFLPAYSPDLNSTEQVFSKLKHLLRIVGERSAAATWRRIGTLLDRFSPAEYDYYFVNSGYAPS